jgi:hypothetical protein
VGQIGPYTISKTSITSFSEYGRLSLGQYALSYDNEERTATVMLGVNVNPYTGTQSIAYIYNHKVNDSVQPHKSNNGLILDIGGVDSSSESASSGSHAIAIENGDVAGLRLRTRRINTNGLVLSHMDNVVLFVNASHITVYLPKEPKEGQIYILKLTNAGSVDLHGNGKIIRHAQSGNIAESASVLIGDALAWRICVWDVYGDKWHLED